MVLCVVVVLGLKENDLVFFIALFWLTNSDIIKMLVSVAFNCILGWQTLHVRHEKFHIFVARNVTSTGAVTTLIEVVRQND